MRCKLRKGTCSFRTSRGGGLSVRRNELAGQIGLARPQTAVGGNRPYSCFNARSEPHYTPHCLALQARFQDDLLDYVLFSRQSLRLLHI